MLDESGSLCAFDLLKDDTGPVGYEEVRPQRGAMDLEGNHRTKLRRDNQDGVAEAKGGRDGVSSPMELRGSDDASVNSNLGSHVPMIALSGDRSTSAIRPRLAVAVAGAIFTRQLSSRFSRSSPGSAVALSEGAKVALRRFTGGDGGRGDECRRMREWLKAATFCS